MRPTASVVIPAWNEWELTRACLESLRPTLGIRDQVVVVDNGSSDETADGLRRYRWVTVVSHAENLGFAAGCNSGAAVATGEVVVFLNNDTLVPARWLDGLLAPFADPTVGATGPRSNFVSGPQLVDAVPYDAGRLSQIQSFARQWRTEHRGLTTDVLRLAGFCFVVRRDLFEHLGRFHETSSVRESEEDRLFLGISQAGNRLVVAHEVFVHHHDQRASDGHLTDRWDLPDAEAAPLRPELAASGDRQPSEPLLSAAVIVKDEEERLGACLASLEGLVDEIVVYDTGSTDGTVALARAAGARVLEGFWDDDFGRARNAALDACRGRWILSVDADEVVEGDGRRLRQELAASRFDRLDLPIDNTDDQDEVVLSHQATRLFLRSRGRWEGRLHERVVALPGSALNGAASEAIRLRHSGYTPSAVRSRGKAERNLRLARADVAATGGNARALHNLARSQNLAGLGEDALATFREVRRLTTDNDVLRQVLREGAQLLLDAGRPRQALAWIRDLRQHSRSSSMADYMEAVARTDLGDLAGALALFSRLQAVADEDYAVSAHELHYRRGLVLAAERQWSEAASELLRCVRGRRVTEPIWTALVESTWRAGQDLTAVADCVADDRLLPVLGQLANAEPQAVDGLAELLWQREPANTTLLAFVARTAPRLPLARGLEWSARLRAAGLSASCPLVAVAAQADTDPLSRLRAAAIAYEAFGDHAGKAALAAAAADVPPGSFVEALHVLDELSPALLYPFVLGAATDRPRALDLARILSSLGADDAAADVLATRAA